MAHDAFGPVPQYEPAGRSEFAGKVLPVRSTVINEDFGAFMGASDAQMIPCRVTGVDFGNLGPHSTVQMVKPDDIDGWHSLKTKKPNGYEMSVVRLGSIPIMRMRRKTKAWRGAAAHDIIYQFLDWVVSAPAGETSIRPWKKEVKASWASEVPESTGGHLKKVDQETTWTIKLNLVRLSTHLRAQQFDFCRNCVTAETLYVETVKHNNFGVTHSAADGEIVRIDPAQLSSTSFHEEKGKHNAEWVLQHLARRDQATEVVKVLEVGGVVDEDIGCFFTCPRLDFHDNFAYCRHVSSKSVQISIMRGPVFLYPIGARLRVSFTMLDSESRGPLHLPVEPADANTNAKRMALANKIIQWELPWRDATVEEMTAEGAYLIRFDGDQEQYLFDPLVFNHRTSAIFSHKPGTELSVFVPGMRTEWVSATVMQQASRKASHLLKINDEDTGTSEALQPIWVDLNAYNHSPIFGSTHSFEEDKARFIDVMSRRHGTIMNIITGEMNDIFSQCLTLKVKVRSDLVSLRSRGAMIPAAVQDPAFGKILENPDGWPLLKSLLEKSTGRHMGFHRSRCLVVRGEPAAGKSTFMNQLIMLALTQGADFLPVLIPVIDLARKIRMKPDKMVGNPAERSPKLPDLALIFIQEQLGEYADMLTQAVYSRQVLFLFDGLDEGGEFKKEIETYIAQLAALDHRVVCTTRPYGYNPGAFEAGFATLELQPLDEKQQSVFADSRLMDKTMLDDFMRGAKAYKELAANPLTLTLLLHDYNMLRDDERCNQWGSRPITTIYRKALHIIIGRVETVLLQREKAGVDLAADEMSAIVEVRRREDLLMLKRIGMVTHMKKVKDFNHAEVMDLERLMQTSITSVWNRISESVRATIFPTISSFVDGNIRLYRFAHLTFQEYLFASACADWLDDTHDEGNRELAAVPQETRVHMVLLIATLSAPWWRQSLHMLRELLQQRHGNFFDLKVEEAKGRSQRDTLTVFAWRSALDILYDISPPGYIEVLRQVIEEWQSDDQQDFPLRVAAEQGLPRECLTLIELGVNVDQVDITGRSALMYGVCHGFVEVVDRLLTRKAQVNLQDKDGFTALHWSLITSPTRMDRVAATESDFGGPKFRAGTTSFAICEDRMHVPRALVERKANPDLQDGNGRTCLHLAVTHGWLDMVHLLLNAKASVTLKDRCAATPPMLAIHLDKFEVLESLLPRVEGNTLLIVDEHQNTLLHHALAKRHLPTVDRLLRDELASRNLANVRNSQGRQAMHLASAQGLDEILTLLISEFAVKVNSVDNNGCTPLAYAVKEGRRDTVALLLKHRANPNTADHQGRAPIHWAAAKGTGTRNELVQVLVAHGADPNLPEANDQGMRPLHIAAWQGLPTAAATLIKSGANAGLADLSSQTPLHYAVTYEHRNVIASLHQGGASADQADFMGQTPRTKAHTAAVKKLLNQWGKADLAEEASLPVPPPMRERLPSTPKSHLSFAGRASVTLSPKKTPRRAPLYR